MQHLRRQNAGPWGLAADDLPTVTVFHRVDGQDAQVSGPA
jgi:hypothetical protein